MSSRNPDWIGPLMSGRVLRKRSVVVLVGAPRRTGAPGGCPGGGWPGAGGVGAGGAGAGGAAAPGWAAPGNPAGLGTTPGAAVGAAVTTPSEIARVSSAANSSARALFSRTMRRSLIALDTEL